MQVWWCRDRPDRSLRSRLVVVRKGRRSSDWSYESKAGVGQDFCDSVSILKEDLDDRRLTGLLCNGGSSVERTGP